MFLAPGWTIVLENAFLTEPTPSSRCKKYDVPVENIFNKTQREKFAWAIDMADEDFEF